MVEDVPNQNPTLNAEVKTLYSLIVKLNKFQPKRHRVDRSLKTKKKKGTQII